jgi:hypothetical protein
MHVIVVAGGATPRSMAGLSNPIAIKVRGAH